MSHASKENQSIRQFDLDWIRVLATLCVFLYHCSMFFNPFPWHVKNNVINTTYIYSYTLLVGNLIMPIFFAASGISTYHALKKRTGRSFLKERMLRLGVPLVFGVFVLSPPQVYMERVTHNQFTGSFWSFLPHYFNGIYVDIGGTGNFAFVGLHLWYLLELLIFSFLTLPLMRRYFTSQAGKPFTMKQYWLLFLPLLVLGVLLNDVGNIGGWGILFYLCIYWYGYSYLSKESVRSFMRASGRWTGTITIVGTLLYTGWSLYGFPAPGTLPSLLFSIIRVSIVWNGLFFIFYLGDKYLSSTNTFLRYTSEASMPFYVLHQPIIVLLAFFIYNQNWPVPVKLVFLVPTAFCIILVVYHFIIKRVSGIRVLFGMKSLKQDRGAKSTPLVDSNVS